MKIILAALLASGAVVLGAGTPASAASAMSDAFVATAGPQVDFLDDSSRLALDMSHNARLRAFAHDEAMEQTLTGNQFVAWSEINGPSGDAVATSRPAGAPAQVAGDLAAPLDMAVGAARGVTNGVDDVLTGRSVAVAGQPAPLVGVTPPASRRDLDRLRAASGRDFDALYRSTQRDSLDQLATLYRSYIADGDDPALRALAERELPRVEHRLDQLRRL